ncbi:HAD-IIA family hydrolase [Paenibacillus sepulcri]|uniref:Acid sugar phosphatase n=1 Tax=Paenibacillus sepulcri TaxID=359917 RepID=A0ABS7CD94_9BACL|nr:HAD-IIA family hydrolase [Paenibacillus sepulcri]
MKTSIEGFVIDLDGTVYKGSNLINGAAEAVAMLKQLGKRIVFLSNRGNISRKMCHDKLGRLGLDIDEEEILLTSTVTARFLKDYYESSPVWVLGDQGLKDELEAGDILMAERPELAEWLVITLHETLTYEELNDAFRAVRHGARIIATNADKTFPRDDGDSIDVAGMIGAIVSATGREVDIVIGKPSQLMAEAALNVLQLPPERCLVIGDSLESDIRLGKKAGMQTALVLTGSVSMEEAEASHIQPDWIWPSLADVTSILAPAEKGLQR